MKANGRPVRRRPALGLAAVGLLLALPAGASKWKDPSEAEKQIVEDASKGLVGAVYLEKIQRSEGNKTFHVTVRAKILSKSGFDIGSVEGLEVTTDNIEGRTVGPTGKVTELSSRDIHRTTVVKSGGRSVERLSFTMPALEPGCFIEYAYREWGRLGRAGDYHTEILFQDKYTILFQELRTPKAFPYSSTTRRQRGANIEFGPDGGEFFYRVSNAPALHPEPYGLPNNERAAAVIFSWVFHDVNADDVDAFWREITKKGFAPMVTERLAKPSKVEAALKSIPGSRAADPEARLRAIYAYVQKTYKNRWVLRPGESAPKDGWEKNDGAADTISHRSGSSYDLAAVFLSMLRADGYHARVAFLPDREERFFHAEIPSMFQFSAWAVEVKDPGLPAPVYVAFDHPLLAYGMLPSNHLGGAVWVVDVDAETGEKVDLPQWPAERNSRRRAWAVAVEEEGDARVVREQRSAGQQAYESRVRLYRQGKELLEKEVRETYEKLDPPVELEAIEIQNAEEPEKEYLQTTTFRRKSLASSLPGGRLELAPLTMLQQSNPFTQDKREEPILFSYPWLDEDTLTITPPPGYVVDALPPPAALTTMAGKFPPGPPAARATPSPSRACSRSTASRPGPSSTPVPHALRSGLARRQRVLDRLQERRVRPEGRPVGVRAEGRRGGIGRPPAPSRRDVRGEGSRLGATRRRGLDRPRHPRDEAGPQRRRALAPADREGGQLHGLHAPLPQGGRQDPEPQRRRRRRLPLELRRRLEGRRRGRVDRPRRRPRRGAQPRQRGLRPAGRRRVLQRPLHRRVPPAEPDPGRHRRVRALAQVAPGRLPVGDLVRRTICCCPAGGRR